MKSGYKQTEVGVIPEEWDAKAIGSEIDLLTGFPFPSSGYAKAGVRLLRGSNIKRGVTDWSEEITQHWPAVTRELTRYSMMAGDLVISMDGSLVGRSFAQLEESDLPALLLQRVARIRATELDVSYLRQFVGGDQFIKYVDSVKTVTAIPHISPSDIRRFAIPVPPTLSEQRAIATALSDMDALLAGLDRLIAKKRDLKQAAMQQLLTGRKRLPGFKGEWEVKRLGDIAHIKTGGRNNEDKVEDGQYPFFVRSDVVERINSYSHDCEAVLVPGEGRIGDIFHYINGRFDVHQRVYAIKPLPLRPQPERLRAAALRREGQARRRRADRDGLAHRLEAPERNRFAIAEEVTVKAADAKASTKRPDIVLYVNGIALGVLELKRSTVSVSEGIRQNLDNQKKEFIQPFFSTMQYVMAGNDTEGLRYGTIQTPEKYYLTWKEAVGPGDNPLDRRCAALREGALPRADPRLHRVRRRHQEALPPQPVLRRARRPGARPAREGGIIWHTQGSGKSLTMVWLAKWIRENVKDARVLIITDRTELDEQIEKVFNGVNENIYRTKSGADLIAMLNASPVADLLAHPQVRRQGGRRGGRRHQALRRGAEAVAPKGFKAKGNLFVFVDECHRTQSGDLHQAMKALLPGAVFIGFTGTPLLKADKKKSIEIFGGYIHTYKFDEAVADGVVLDLRYEARDIDQSITSPTKIDSGSRPRPRADALPRPSSRSAGAPCRRSSRASRGWSHRRRHPDGHGDEAAADERQGNAMLVAGSIYEACKFYELFAKTTSRASARSSRPTHRASPTSRARRPARARPTRSRSTHLPADAGGLVQRARRKAVNKVEEFEKAVKKKFIDEPGQMKLLIVVDKLLTGFDAPPATYLYIDKQMRDHGLFQAICRVNRLDGDDKDYGYIVDYKDLFKRIEGAVRTTPRARSTASTRRTWPGCSRTASRRAASAWRRRWRPCGRCASRSSRRATTRPSTATSRRASTATPTSSRPTSRSASRCTSSSPRWCVRTRTWRPR
jgi:hypothetical protein